MKRNRGTTIWCAVALGAVLISMPAWGQQPGPCTKGFKIGDCPGWVDLNANGMYDPGEPLINFFCVADGSTSLQISNPWTDNCDQKGNSNLIMFDTDNGQCWTRAHRFSGRRYQEMQVTGFNGNNQPTAFHFVEDFGLGASGDGALQGPDGGFNALSITGGMMMLVGPFQGTDASGGGGSFNHATIPWALAGALGMNGPCKLGPIDPQPFLPIVDMGNGQYQFQFNLCDDSRFCPSPMLSLVAWRGVGNIPTLSEWGMIVLVLGLATLGWWFLRRQQLLA